MKFLLGSKVIGENPKEIAAFFLQTEGLNKKHIGEYLGGSYDLFSDRHSPQN